MTGTGMDATLYDQARARLRTSTRKRKEPEPVGNLFDHVPRVSPDNDLFKQLVAIANDVEHQHTRNRGPLYGVTIGEVVFEAEQNRGVVVQAPEMEDKGKQQRATSGLLSRVLPRAGFVRTASYRSSPVKRHHGTPHRVYVRRDVNP